jgi:hypothetical protein
MVNEDAALLNRRVTHMTPAALFSRRLQFSVSKTHQSKNMLSRSFPSPPKSGLGCILADASIPSFK